MIIVGCDYHPSFQQIAFVDTETGEVRERRLFHREEAEQFYRNVAAQGIKVRVGAHAGPYLRAVEHGIAIPMEKEHIRSAARALCLGHSGS